MPHKGRILIRSVLAFGSWACASPRQTYRSGETLPDTAYASAYRLYGVHDSTGFTAHLLAHEFRGAKEPGLNQPHLPGEPDVYRLTHLAGWGGVGVYRLERRGRGWVVVVKATTVDNDSTRTDSISPSTTIRSLVDSRRLKLVFSDSARVGVHAPDALLSLLQRTDFWRKPDLRCKSLGIDGYSMLLEVRRKGEYIARKCWSPKLVKAQEIQATIEAFEEFADSAISRHARKD
jgi:hypothetical protein